MSLECLAEPSLASVENVASEAHYVALCAALFPFSFDLFIYIPIMQHIVNAYRFNIHHL